MPTTPQGVHYLDDPRELLAIFRSWGRRAAILHIELDGAAQVFISEPPGKTCYASAEAFAACLSGLTPRSDGPGWRVKQF